MAYDDAKYGVVERQWFGLHLNKGGAVAAASGFTCGAEAATSNNHIDRLFRLSIEYILYKARRKS